MIQEGMVNSLERAMRVVEVLGEVGPSRVNVLARMLALPPSTTHRLLTSLVRLGYVQQDPYSREYSLSPKLFRIGATVINRMPLIQAARPVLLTLARETQAEAVVLGVLADKAALCIERVAGPLVLPVVAELGAEAPLYCTALGKTLLAWMPEEERRALLGRIELKRRTPFTLTSVEELERNLSEARTQGYAVSNEESAPGIRAVGAPVFDRSGRGIAAVAVRGSALQLTRASIPEVGRNVANRALEISYSLGLRQKARTLLSD